MDQGVIGTCKDMCPVAERTLREREGMIHLFEMGNSGVNNRTRNRQADPEKTVKCFSRSAAGLSTPLPDMLRPGAVLLKTVRYLLLNVAPLVVDRPMDAYEFITDRLRSVRQDITIQRLPPNVCVPLIEPMVRFHVLFGYFLSTHSRFDPHLNDIHLQECLNTLLKCYQHVSENTNRTCMETIFMCVNVNRPEAVIQQVRDTNGRIGLDILLAWVVKNYVRVLRLSSRLDVVARAALASHVPLLQEQALRTLCHAMTSANSAFPIERLVRTLSYNSTSNLLEDCRRLGIRCSETQCHFHKKDLVASPAPASSKTLWWAVEQDLHFADLPTLLLGS